MSIRVPKEAAHLSPPIDGRGEKHRPSRLERAVGRSTIRHPQRQLVTDLVRILRRRDGPASSNQKDPAALEVEHAGGAAVIAVDCCPENIAVERAARARSLTTNS